MHEPRVAPHHVARAGQHLTHREPCRRSRGVEHPNGPLFGAADAPLAQVSGIDELDGIVGRRSEHVTTAGDPHRPVRVPVGRISRADYQSGTDDRRRAGEGALRFLLRQRLEWAVVAHHPLLVLDVRSVGGRECGTFVRSRHIVGGIDGDRRDEDVLLHPAAERGGGFPHPAGAGGRIVDHDIPLAFAQRIVVAGIGSAIADPLLDVGQAAKDSGVGTATIEQGHMVTTFDGIAHLIGADEAGAAEYQDAECARWRRCSVPAGDGSEEIGAGQQQAGSGSGNQVATRDGHLDSGETV